MTALGGVLEGQTIVVTGASRGIGAAIAVACADAGADVAVGYLSESERAADTVAAVKAKGRTAEAFAADISDETQVDEGAKAFFEKRPPEFRNR